MSNLAVILSLSLVLSVPGATASDISDEADITALDSETVIEMIEQAEAARSRAADLRAEWLETRDLIEQARHDAELGELEQAARLAMRARRQSELAVEQALREAEAWKRRVVR
jgi:hypothetical protein